MKIKEILGVFIAIAVYSVDVLGQRVVANVDVKLPPKMNINLANFVNQTKTHPEWRNNPGINIPKIKWTKANDVPFTPKKEHRIAYRDIILEMTVLRFFQSSMEKIRHPEWGLIPEIFRDPMPIKGGLDLTKKSSLIDIHLSTDQMSICGLHNLKMVYIRVIRRYGFRDIKVQMKIQSDLKIDGFYKLKGKALGFIPANGDGKFNIDIKNASISVITFLAMQKNEKTNLEELIMRELKASVDYKDVHFHFDNLMGGGVMSSAVNMVINNIGEAILDSQRVGIIDLMKTTFKREVSKYM